MKMSKIFLNVSCCVLFGASFIASDATAQGTAFTFTLGSNPLTNASVAEGLGWEFRVQNSIRITALGLFDNGRNGFTDPHTVQVWTNSASVGSAVCSLLLFGDGIPSENGFAYSSLTPVILLPGDYIITASFAANSADPYPVNVQNVSTDPLISFVQARFGVASGFPDQIGTGLNFFAPNFKFGQVPEPAGAALLSAGCAVMLALRWKRRSC